MSSIQQKIQRYEAAMATFTKDQKHEMAIWMRLNPTPGERELWEFLEAENIRWQRQKMASRAPGMAVPKWRCQYHKYGFIADFYCPFYKLVIEVDGSGHLKPERRAMDVLKDKVFAEKGIRVMRERWPFQRPPAVFVPEFIALRRDDFAGLS